MPELPEVERAASLLRSKFRNKTITQVETVEDTIVYTGGITHEEFASEITGRVVKNAGRYGKVFYLELDGDGRHPVMHFGMTGMIQIRGEGPIVYGDQPKSKPSGDWPPRFWKFILHFNGNDDKGTVMLAFMDARRLGRIRLCASPLKEAPISDLGFDPILSMPTLEAFSPLVLRRSCPIKALLLDQSFSAGVGNWIADEVLYHSRVHPEQRCNTLSPDQISAIHTQIVYVCKTAVQVDANSKRFPSNWLFKHRWGKGKRANHTMKLPNGSPATIKWITVGGRTSAFIAELQKVNSALPKGKRLQQTIDNDEAESSLIELSGTEEHSLAVRRKRKIKEKVETKAIKKQKVTSSIKARRSRRTTARAQSSRENETKKDDGY